MARRITDQDNYENPTPEYPRGRYKDRTQTEEGTTINNKSYGDFVEFFRKLLIDANINENGLQDNTANGYQYLEALIDKIQNTDLSASQIVSGILSSARIPGINANKLISGILSDERIPKSDESDSIQGIKNDVFMTSLSARHASERNMFVYDNNFTSFFLNDKYTSVLIASNMTSGTMHMPNPANSWNIGRKIRIYSDGSNGVEILQYNGDNIIANFSAYYYAILECLSTTRWALTFYQSAPIACPYVYINGLFVDEILRNQIFERNYRVDTIDITKSVKKGINILELTEEKEEETYIDYLHLIVDGVKVKKFFSEKRTMQYGTQYRFEFKAPEKYKKIEVSAKGYYIPL